VHPRAGLIAGHYRCCAHLDTLSAVAGLSNFGGVGSDNVNMLGGWVPGTCPYCNIQADLVCAYLRTVYCFAIHYLLVRRDKWLATEIHFFFNIIPVAFGMSI